jgi:hypothetical protein
MAGPTDDDEHTPPQSPRTKGIVQALVREVKKHTEGIDADVQVTNERIGVLEATHNLAALLRRFDDLMTWEHDQHQGHNNNNNYDEQVDDNWDKYSADSELDDQDARRPVQHIRHGRDGHRWWEVRNNDNAFHKLKFKIPPFDANMILMLIFLGNWLLNKNLHALNFLKMLGLEQPLVNSLILLLFGGWNMARNILMTYHKLGLL